MQARASAPRSTLKPPRVPYQETIRGSREGARAPQEADRRPRPVRRLPHRDRAARRRRRLRVRQRDQGRRDPARASSPRSRRACVEAMQQGAVAGYPVKGVRVRLFDGSYHSVDSSEMAFKIAGSIAMKRGARAGRPGAARADHARHARRCPTTSVGDVMGDLSSRRGRPLGTEAVGGMTEVKAEVPMAEMLDLRAGPALDHRRPGRVHAGVPALRGGPVAPRAEGRARSTREEEPTTA